MVLRLSLFLQIPTRVALLSWISISFVSKLISPADIYFVHKNTIDPLKKKKPNVDYKYNRLVNGRYPKKQS